MRSDDITSEHHGNGAPRPFAVVILAAGKGTRMGSDLPKVVHAVAGRPMIQWVVDAARRAGAARIILVVGHEAGRVRALFAGARDVDFVEQAEQLGTGHATLMAEPALRGFRGDVIVLAGDGPLVRAATLRRLVERHRAAGAAATLASAVVPDPTGYGRIVRDASNRFAGIVEHRNATDEQRAIREIYPSYACFDAAALFAELRDLEPDPLAGELYLTDVPARLLGRGGRVEVVDAVPAEDVLSINTPQQLAEVDAILTARQESEA